MEDETVTAENEQTLTPAEEAENTAEIAIALADDANARITQCEAQIEALMQRLNALESEQSNVRPSTELSEGIAPDNQPEAGQTPEESISIIEPKREHPYFRKLW